MISHMTLLCCIHLQVDQEVAKLLELKAKLSDNEGTGGKFVLKCPKVIQCWSNFCVSIIFLIIAGNS